MGFRFVRIFTPFAILLLIFVLSYLLNLTPQEFFQHGSSATDSLPATVVDHTPTPPTDISSQTPEPSPTAAIDPPINPEGAETALETTIPDHLSIRLIGPPPASSFFIPGTITFYWIWPQELAETQLFEVILIHKGSEIIAGTIDQPSLGSHGYQFNFSPEDTIAPQEITQWRINLKDKNSGLLLLKSENRLVEFLAMLP